MPLITERLDYNGFTAKIKRLSIEDLVLEAENTLHSFELKILPSRFANGTRGIRQQLDLAFSSLGRWSKITVGGVDWTARSEQGASIGVEVQVSGRSDMLAVDIMHLKDKIEAGAMDVGMIIVPDDHLSRFLTDRTPNFRTARKHVDDRAKNLPIRIVAFGADGEGAALVKMRTNLGRK